jgi:hypothetical protein
MEMCCNYLEVLVEGVRTLVVEEVVEWCLVGVDTVYKWS